MKLFTRLFFLGLFFALGSVPLRAQLFVDPMPYSAEELVMDFFNGTCVDVSQVEFIGVLPEQITFFEGSQSGLGVNAGLILATGNPVAAVGPNTEGGASAGYGVAFPNPLIGSLSTGANYDLAMLHFTIVPHIDSIGFKYVFGSEEFCEYVNSQFNDVFGFWISGPGFTGQQNIALVPSSTTTPVAINNVNHLLNSAYYINNIPADGYLCGQSASTAPTVSTVQYDGLTTVLTASAHVVPEQTYEIWIGISDISDGIFDSGVFLSVESLCGDSLLSPVAAFAMQVNGNAVTFQNTTKYATAWHWDFGDGSTSDERYPTHTYASLDQQYTVKLVSTNYCCSDTSVVLIGTSSVTDKGYFDCKVYPTRFNDQLTIEPAQDFANGIARLSDLTGRVVFQGAFNGKTVLNVGTVSKGAYLLELVTGDQRRVVYKVVK